MIKTRDFTFADGLTHGLVGPNGIGKTTLLRKIAGQIQSGGITAVSYTHLTLPTNREV